MAQVKFENVDKVFDNGVKAVANMSLDVRDGEFLVLVGPSGCGKTTALRMVAGLEAISSGTVSIGDTVVNNLTSKDRDIAMVFQNYALYPHLSVADNIAFGLRLRKEPKEKIAKQVEWAATMLDLVPYLNRRPKELSGGQRQRVAMGRAIVREPKVFLMDEPLSNLDAQLRVQMRGDIRSLQREFRTTTVYVTHDQTEAMTMGDRVAVLRDGRLQQLGSPDEVFGSPKNLFVARFIGSPSMNLVYGQIEQSGTGLTLRIGSQLIMLPTKDDQRSASLRAYIGRRVVVGIRPHSLKDPVVTPMRDAGLIRGVVRLRESLGTETVLHVAVDAERFGGKTSSESEEVTLASETRLVACVDPASRVKEGESVALAIEAHRLHIFDRETEESIL